MSAGLAKAPLALERRSTIRFSISALVKYELDGRTGTATTLDMSSGGIAFQTDSILQVGRPIRLFMNWPGALDGRVPLSLVIDGNVLRSTQFGTVVPISRYDFRLRAGKAKRPNATDDCGRRPAQA